MALRCGIVGLPNVGKSSLFNALTEAAVAAENYPFCTIEPNVGVVPLPDSRLSQIAEVAGSARTVPASLRLVDIAGLVSGASKGEGLGNKFLAHIREVDGIVHVLRCFDESEIAHVAGKVDPIEDARTVEFELILADLETLGRAQDRLARLARSGDKEAAAQLESVITVVKGLDAGASVRSQGLDSTCKDHVAELCLLTAKPVLYCANLSESATPESSELLQSVKSYATETGANAISVSARLEAELVSLEPGDRQAMLEELGQHEPGLDRLVHSAFALLGLGTFFTAGPNETRAWEFRLGSTAEQAAGIIHTDMQRGFIRAETIFWEDYISHGGESGCREAGRLRIEGRDYLVVDGDVMHFRFNV